MTLRPYLRWAGGKQGLVQDLMLNIPNVSEINNYFEPFFGAGSLFYANSFKSAYLSDINSQLINAHSFIKTQPTKLFNLLLNLFQHYENNKSFYYQIRNEYNSENNILSLKQASRFLFLIHTNYNGMYRVNKLGEYNVPIGKLNPTLPNHSNFLALSKSLKNATLTCCNYLDILQKVKSNDFVYIDPPYPPLTWKSIENQYTVNNFSQKDHENLAKFAIKLASRNCFIMISYPNTDFIRSLYSNWNLIELSAFRSISCKKERIQISELLIKNY